MPTLLLDGNARGAVSAIASVGAETKKVGQAAQNVGNIYAAQNQKIIQAMRQQRLEQGHQHQENPALHEKGAIDVNGRDFCGRDEVGHIDHLGQRFRPFPSSRANPARMPEVREGGVQVSRDIAAVNGAR